VFSQSICTTLSESVAPVSLYAQALVLYFTSDGHWAGFYRIPPKFCSSKPLSSEFAYKLSVAGSPRISTGITTPPAVGVGNLNRPRKPTKGGAFYSRTLPFRLLIDGGH
jgi:hypothetical protein